MWPEVLNGWFRKSIGEQATAEKESIKLVMTTPPSASETFEKRMPRVAPTHEVFTELFSSARKEVRIFSPYVDPTFTSLLQMCKAPVWIVTTARDGRPPRSNPVLERCAASRDVVVRYVVERRNGAQLFQMHAKMIIADGRVAYIGSANLTDTSIHYNLEMGVWVQDRDMVSKLSRVFDFVMEVLSVPAKMI
jgi:phosphatidylserine/phosphatidylglycerophosphate/cardiolipin synthase-like enzyme